MVIEVFKDGLTIGFVIAKDRISSVDLIASAFPQVDRICTDSYLPKTDPRCKKITDNIYSWCSKIEK